MVSLVLTIIGPDRVGIVQSLSDVIVAHNGNWVESRMAQLSGKFAGLLRVDVADSSADGLAAALRGLEGQGLHVVIERSDEGAALPEPLTAVTLDLMGADHPGIVRDIAHTLAQSGVNVEELNTECIPAPMTGEPLFQATATLRVPAGLSLDDLVASLERVGADLMVDLSLDAGD